MLFLSFCLYAAKLMKVEMSEKKTDSNIAFATKKTKFVIKTGCIEIRTLLSYLINMRVK